ncbi:unnamed protein product [Effrenium voratum]|nr:unnamed protein product [Effrenium voratum]CAJ1417062.1 unnamed protein product [Effrenium voratum]
MSIGPVQEAFLPTFQLSNVETTEDLQDSSATQLEAEAEQQQTGNVGQLEAEVIPTAAITENAYEDVPPALCQLAQYDDPSEVSRVLLRLMRRLLCRRSEAMDADLAEQQLTQWLWEWLDLTQDDRLSLTATAVKGFAGLPLQVQARHLALLIDIKLATFRMEQDVAEDATEANDIERCARGVRVYQLLLAALTPLADDELDSIGQAAVGEFQALVSPLGMARVVLRLSPYRRRQLTHILVRDEIMEELSALRLGRALTALDSMLGTETLDAVLTGMDAAVSVGSGVLGVGSGILAAGANVLDSLGTLGNASMDLGIYPALFPLADEGPTQETATVPAMSEPHAELSRADACVASGPTDQHDFL